MGDVVGPRSPVEVAHPVLCPWIVEPSRHRRVRSLRLCRSFADPPVRLENRHQMPPGFRLCIT